MEMRLKLFRTIISVNQLSIYGAISDLCEEYSNDTHILDWPVPAQVNLLQK